MPSLLSTTSVRGVFDNLHWVCPHCRKENAALELTLLGVPVKVPAYGSCGCEESQWDGLEVRREDRRYARAGIPERFLGVDCDLKGYQHQVANGMSLYIHGGNGTGKSEFASVLGKALVNMGMSVMFKEMPQLVREFQAAYSGTQTDVLERASACDVLILDDLGKERVTSDSLYIAFLLIDARYSAMKPTVITTNFTRGALATRYSEADEATGEAIASRLCQDSIDIEMEGEDWRITGRRDDRRREYLP